MEPLADIAEFTVQVRQLLCGAFLVFVGPLYLVFQPFQFVTVGIDLFPEPVDLVLIQFGAAGDLCLLGLELALDVFGGRGRGPREIVGQVEGNATTNSAIMKAPINPSTDAIIRRNGLFAA